MPSLTAALQTLTGAKSAEDVFGPLTGADVAAKLESLKFARRNLAKATHEDLFLVAEKPRARQAFQLMEGWYAKAEERVKLGLYGDMRAMKPVTLTTKAASYELLTKLGVGELSTVYRGMTGGEAVLVKVSHGPACNDLLASEAATLRGISEGKASGLKLRHHLPRVLTSFEVTTKGVKRRVNVFKLEADLYSLREVRDRYHTGLPLADAAWMFNRLLAAIYVAHLGGYVHGAVSLDHALIRPGDHYGQLVSWGLAVTAGQKLRAMSKSCQHLYPPEVKAGKPVDAGTDLYMAAGCLLALVHRPEALPPAVAGLLRACRLGPAHRLKDPFEVYDDFNTALRQLYGAPKFREFNMPPVAA